MKRDEQMMNAAEAYTEEIGYKDDNDMCCTMNTFCAGWYAADRCSQWIPVKKELPKEKGAYLFHFDDGQTRVEGYFPELHLSKCVTHWMPLPQPPQGKEE